MSAVFSTSVESNDTATGQPFASAYDVQWLAVRNTRGLTSAPVQSSCQWPLANTMNPPTLR